MPFSYGLTKCELSQFQLSEILTAKSFKICHNRSVFHLTLSHMGSYGLHTYDMDLKFGMLE